MIKLKPLLTTEADSDNSDEWDDWYDYLKDVSYDIDKDEIIKLINKHGLKGKKYFDGKIVKLWDGKQEAYLEYDPDNGTADFIKEIEQWIYSLNDNDYYRLGVDSDIIYSIWVESSLKDLRENPGKVYHYTTEENWEAIQQDGQIIGSSGTGINNRSAYGIFTSVDPQEYALGSYGNICLELDLERYKIESGKPSLNLRFEPQVEEYLSREYIRSMLKLGDSRDEIENDGGISPYTVIVKEIIPLKYIKQV